MGRPPMLDGSGPCVRLGTTGKDRAMTARPGVSTPAGARSSAAALVGLAAASHPGPSVAVTVLAAILAAALDQPPGRVVLVALAVLAGQLSVGWSNDLVDRARDRAVGRTDKPLASGSVSTRTAVAACAAAVVLAVVLSLACGWWAGLVHLAGVAAGWAYNLGLKATVWSWAPFALAFAALTVFVWLAGDPGTAPPVWLPVAGACLGTGAHLLNVLPDLEDDAATGVRGLPHRLGAARLPAVALVALMAGSVAALAGAAATPVAWVLTLAALSGLGVVVLRGRGRAPFAAAVGIALADVVLLVVAL